MNWSATTAHVFSTSNGKRATVSNSVTRIFDNFETGKYSSLTGCCSMTNGVNSFKRKAESLLDDHEIYVPVPADVKKLRLETCTETPYYRSTVSNGEVHIHEEMDCEIHDNEDFHPTIFTAQKGSLPRQGDTDFKTAEISGFGSLSRPKFGTDNPRRDARYLADRKECLRCLTGEGGHFSHILSNDVPNNAQYNRGGTRCLYPW